MTSLLFSPDPDSEIEIFIFFKLLAESTVGVGSLAPKPVGVGSFEIEFE